MPGGGGSGGDGGGGGMLFCCGDDSVGCFVLIYAGVFVGCCGRDVATGGADGGTALMLTVECCHFRCCCFYFL